MVAGQEKTIEVEEDEVRTGAVAGGLGRVPAVNERVGDKSLQPTLLIALKPTI